MSVRTVLVIDDDQNLYSIIESALATVNIQCTFARDSDIGLTLAAQNVPDLILMDLMLPKGVKGWDVIAELKGNPTTKHIPIIAFSATNNQSVQLAIQAGASDFISKPFRIAQFQHTIQQYLGAAQR